MARSVTPATAERIEARKTAILAASKSASDRSASPAMNSPPGRGDLVPIGGAGRRHSSV
jgi:hypothetical protein